MHQTFGRSRQELASNGGLGGGFGANGGGERRGEDSSEVALPWFSEGVQYLNSHLRASERGDSPAAWAGISAEEFLGGWMIRARGALSNDLGRIRRCARPVSADGLRRGPVGLFGTWAGMSFPVASGCLSA